MTTGTPLIRTLGFASAVLIVSAALLLTPAYAGTPQPRSLGLENPSKMMNIHILLNLRNESALKSLVAGIQDKNSPNYRKFLTKQQFAAQFAPTAASSKQVADFLAANGLKVTYIDSHNLSVSATGTVAAIQSLFNTQIEKLQLNGETFDSPTAEPTVSPSISSLVKSVGGLHTMQAKFHLAWASTYKNNKAVRIPPVKFVKGKTNGVFFPGNCFNQSSDILYLTGPGLEAIYSGNEYPDAGCGYSPAEMQHAYGFDSVIKSGLDGTGQVITILDPYGSYSILTDANTFSGVYGLPALVPGVNFNLIYNPTGGTPDCVIGPTNQCGAEMEVTLDVEWAHAMAPGATIDLVTTPTFGFGDLWATDLWIAENLNTGSVSHSYGGPESEVYLFDYPDFFDQYEVNYIAANIFGVANNYSSGDGGDDYGAGVVSALTDVSFPAGSPDATSVGGTSLALDSSGNYKFQEGWGNNIALIGEVPPASFFYAGAGGGTSQVTSAPPWQASLLGAANRQQPDVSFDADPFTGAEIIYTGDFNPGDAQFVTVIGGTSLASPMFTAVWGLVEQEVGTPYLGNAAASMYYEQAEFPSSFIDVQPVGSGHNSHGTIFCNGKPCYNESQWDLAGPYQSSPVFYESLWNAQLISVTMGTDSSLITGPGWDNVTGLGTPNGASFLTPFVTP